MSSAEKGSTDGDLIDFDGPSDPYMPLNWSMRKKVVNTMIYSFCTMGTTWAVTIYNSGIGQIESQFHVSKEVALLGMTLFLLGNGFGPLIWAPLSEAYGRKYTTAVIPTFGLMVFSFASAASKDFQTLMITRFFAGVFGVAPQSNVGGVLADIWPATQRGIAMLAWGFSVVAGPLVSPIVGGALVISLPETGWRWTEYVTGIMLAAICLASLFFVEESYAPVLLARKASKIRLETRNWAIHSKSQEASPTLTYFARKYGVVPFEMLVDPICFCVNLYAAFVYAMIYLAITAYPIEFQQVRGWNAVVGSVPLLAIVIGVVFGCCINYFGQSYYNRRLAALGAKILPEARLLPIMIGAPFFTGGLFIMGWTAKADIHWIGFCIGAACIGLGFVTIFQNSTNYLVDTYLMQAASALAANMFVRSVLAATFPLFCDALFHNLGLDWGMSLAGFISTAMTPIPFLFYAFGKTLRARGKRSKASVEI